MSKTLRRAVAALLLVLPLAGQALEWPQEVVAPEGRIVVYQPQPERFEDNRLVGRAAMSILPTGSEEPIFGTFWFESRVDTERGEDSALVRDIAVTRVRWPDSRDAEEQRFTAIVEAAMPVHGFEISMTRLAASLATAELETQSLENLNNDPPKIVFRENLAVLLTYDGKPRYGKIDNSAYERVLNTPIAVVRDKRGQHYATNGKLWYQSASATGPWQHTNSPPADLVAALPQAADTPDWDTPPEIVVATEPTELIVSDGPPEWKPLAGGDVLYVTNTESPWLRDLGTGNMYLLLSGRWYRAKTSAGPWTFVPADELPAAFADIPPASEIGGLRTSVAGTPEAEDAVLDAQVPQTAAISRDTTLEVSYSGAPQFEAVTGTSVAYAVNTATQVLKIDKRYYAVDAGVWFSSASPTGPWVVADDIPREEIASIPPSAPVYNTTYVNVYDSSPEVVYVGYTPGYLWSFPYYGVPVYGSGWHYRPWPGPWYYPHTPTWGFNVGYNPWTGWNFGLSWSNGFFSFGVRWGGGYPHHHHHGWYGGGYRGPVVINTGDINIGNTVNAGNRVDIGNKVRNNQLSVNRQGLRRENLYRQAGNRERLAEPALARRDLERARSQRELGNNVYADRDGRVARHVDDKWQSRDRGQWKPDPQLNLPAAGRPSAGRPAAQPAANASPYSAPAARDRRADLERARMARNSGLRAERARPVQRPQIHRRN